MTGCNGVAQKEEVANIFKTSIDKRAVYKMNLSLSVTAAR